MKTAFYLIFVIVLIFSLNGSTVEAQENITLQIAAGFDSFYKIGTWTPLHVEVSNAGNTNLQAKLQVLDDKVEFGAQEALYVYPLDLPAQSRKQVTLYLPLRGQNRLQVELVGSDAAPILTEKIALVPLSKEDFLIGVVASNPSLLNGLGNFKSRSGGHVGVAHLTLDNLPLISAAWIGLDLLVLNDIDTSQLSSTQQELLQAWVHFGGHLLVGGGPNAIQTTTGLASLLPFSTVTVQTLPYPLTALAAYQPEKSLPDRGPYVAAVPVNVTGQILVKENNIPLIISQARGLGQVYYLALDLGLAPLDTLLPESRLLPGVIGPLEQKNEHLTRQANKQEMVSSLALIPGQTLPSIGTVILYLIVYVLIIGPVNYVVLSRLKKKEWAWFSIPLIIFIFSLSSYTSSFRLRSGQPLLRQITVLQSEIGTPWAEAVTYVGIYSPQRADYTLELNQPISIEALPSQVYELTGQLEVSLGQTTTIDHIRGDIGGMSGVVAYGQSKPPQLDGSLQLDVSNYHIVGNLTNNTGQPITDALLVVNNHMIKLGTLGVGETRLNQMVPEWNNYYGGIYFDYYDQPLDTEQDPGEQLRQASRDTAVRAVLTGYQGNTDFLLPDNSLYLIGWQNGSVFDFKLSPTSYDKMDETLLLVRLAYTVE